jgi:hypothetical protein
MDLDNMHTPNLEYTFSLITFWYSLDSFTEIHMFNYTQAFCEIKY